MVGPDGDTLLLANLCSCPCLHIPNPYHRGNRERNKRRILSSLCALDRKKWILKSIVNVTWKISLEELKVN